MTDVLEDRAFQPGPPPGNATVAVGGLPHIVHYHSSAAYTLTRTPMLLPEVVAEQLKVEAWQYGVHLEVVH
jgi:hypothetical protein